MATTALSACILAVGPVSCTFPHPETWILAKRGAKLNPKIVPALPSLEEDPPHVLRPPKERVPLPCHSPASEKKVGGSAGYYCFLLCHTVLHSSLAIVADAVSMWRHQLHAFTRPV